MGGDQRELATNLADFVGLAEDPVLFFVMLITVASTTYAVMRLLLVPVLNRLMERTKTKWDDILASKGVLFWLALLGPALILYFGAGYASEYAEIWRRIILAGVIVIGGGIIDRVLSAALDIYGLYPFSKKRPIKALIQLLKLRALPKTRHAGHGEHGAARVPIPRLECRLEIRHRRRGPRLRAIVDRIALLHASAIEQEALLGPIEVERHLLQDVRRQQCVLPQREQRWRRPSRRPRH